MVRAGELEGVGRVLWDEPTQRSLEPWRSWILLLQLHGRLCWWRCMISVEASRWSCHPWWWQLLAWREGWWRHPAVRRKCPLGRLIRRMECIIMLGLKRRLSKWSRYWRRWWRPPVNVALHHLHSVYGEVEPLFLWDLPQLCSQVCYKTLHMLLVWRQLAGGRRQCERLT